MTERASCGVFIHSRGRSRFSPPSKIFLLSLLLIPSLVVIAQQGEEAPGGKSAADPSQFVGSQTCKRCHRDMFIPWEQTAHRLTDLQLRRSIDEKGCEGCHGPGRKHVEGGNKENIFSFKGASARLVNASCLKCHGRDKNRLRFRRSQHNLNTVACTDCHEPHPNLIAATEPLRARPIGLERSRSNKPLLRQTLPDLCFSCHREIEAQFALPVRHRVAEGLVRCNDCHNQHGSLTAPQLRSVKNDRTRICLSCHSEKAGPFAFEHAPVKVEGCTVCHTPHGSINKHLLKRREGRFLCLECHALPQATNVPHGRLGFLAGGECVRCHSQIHGSNFSPFFLQ